MLQRGRFVMNWNGLLLEWVCRINPSKFFIIKKPLRILACNCMLECSGIMSRSSESMTVINDTKV